MTERNKILKEKIERLKQQGFSFSNQMIAKYLMDKKIVQPNGIPYDRYSVANRIKSDYTDSNIENAVEQVSVSVKKGNKLIWRYSQSVGAPVKKKK